jgi:ArsR family transcriptional regulator, arsenate/arsenite/antimonite-responsive transcriptional repressor / arsenate reductase (thioredoxin)
MKKRVLFICSGNSDRSLMAEAILRNQASEFFDVFSAGICPKAPDPEAIGSIQRFKLPTVQLNSKPLTQFFNARFDFVIVLCDKAKKSRDLLNFHFINDVIFWNFADLKERQCANPYDTTFKELNERIKMFVLV